MARYERMGDLISSQRLGSFETFGNFGNFGNLAGPECDSWTAKCKANDQKDPDPNNRRACWSTKEYACKKEAGDPNWRPGQNQPNAGASPPSSSSDITGASVGNVLTGVGAILGPIANAFATGYSAKLQVDFQKNQLRNRAPSYGVPMPMMLPLPRRSNAGLVVGGVFVGLLVVGGLIYAVAS